MAKTFTTYLNESKKSWKFSIKTIHDLTNDQCDRIEKHLGKYDSKGLGAAKKTILQSAPRDFPNHKGYEVFIHEFECDRIASGWQVQNDIRNMLGLADGVLKVIGEHEPQEAIPVGTQKEVASVLADAEYNSEPLPDDATSSTQRAGPTKSGYCYIGEDRGFRSCVSVKDSDVCMSGQIFPSNEICVNPSLRE